MLKELVKDLKATGASYVDMAAGAQLSVTSVQNIIEGKNTNPKLSTLESLRNFVEKWEKK